MSEITLEYGPEFQRVALKHMLQNPSFCSKCCQHLKDEYFSGELSWFFRQVREHHQEFKRPPTKEEVKVRVGRFQGGEHSTYEKELDSIVTAEGVGIDFMKKELTGFIQANVFVSSIRKGADLYNLKTYESRQQAYRMVVEKAREVLSIDFQNDRMVRFGDHEKVLEEACNHSRDAIPTGIRPIDEALHGGMMPQTFTLFLGGTNVGKSMICPTLAKFAAQKNKRTFITIHEDEVLETKLRYLACWAEMPYNKLVQPRIDWSDEERKRVKDADDRLKEYVTMKFMYGKERYVEVVTDEVRRMKDHWNFDLFLCDYGQCLKTHERYEKKHDVQEFIYEELKQVCMEMDLVGAGGAQANRLGHTIARKGADLLRVNDIGDSFGISRKASNVITMNRSDSQKGNDRMTYLLDKVRNGRCPVAVEVVTDYAKCMTHSEWSETKSNQTEVSIEDALKRAE